MFNYYNLNTIPIILNRFKVNNIVICGLPDESIVNQIFEYCDNDSKSCIAIDQNDGHTIDYIHDYPLNTLKDLNNYEAIFLNDDPNWYTVYNELNIIKKSNEEFPLVFICHNIFPHKRRDSYIDPEIIPKEFVNDFSKMLDYNGINIRDDYYHAVEENTSKNGVLTAIEDFLDENKSIGVMDFKLTNGITILYLQNSISHIRLSRLHEEIDDYIVEYKDLPDEIFENQLLTSHIAKFKLLNENIDIIDEYKEELSEKEKTIENYKYKVKLHEDKFDYKDSQIERYESQLNLKDAQIKNIESKLNNHKNEINNLSVKLNEANNEIKEKNYQLTLKNQEITDKDIKIKDSLNQLTLKNQEISDKDIKIKNNINQIKNAENQLKSKDGMLTSLKQQNLEQISKLNNKGYCISCYKEEISNNHLEIEYLKKRSFIKKLLNPFAYLYLILKSTPKELSLNFKLYKALKNSKCFDIGFYLNNNQDIIESKWCKYFSPELHYVCNGFNESRKFNKKYFNRNSKKELLEYILNCNY